MIDVTGRVLVWIVRRLGGMTLIRLCLLALALANVSWGLLTVIGKVSAGPLLLISMVAMLTGWLMGRFRLNGPVSALLGLVTGLLYLSLTVGRIGVPLLAFVRTLSPLTSQILHCSIWPSLKQILPCASPNFHPAFATWKTLILTIQTLMMRIYSWFIGVHSGLLVVDPLVAPCLWGAAVWAVSAWAGWWVRRRNSGLIGLLPALVLLGYNIYYTNILKGVYSLVWAAGTTVLLHSANTYRDSEKHWTSRRMDRVLIEPGLVVSVVGIVGMLMLAGGLLPSLSIKKINTAIQDILHPSQNRNLAQSLGLQQVPPSGGKAKPGIGPVVIQEVHAVGPGPHLSADVVMYVSVDGFSPLPPDIARITNTLSTGVTYYWRAQTYDTYTGRVWIANNSQHVALKAGSPYYPGLVNLAANYQEVTQHVERLDAASRVLFYTGDLLSTDQASVADYRGGGDMIDAQTDAIQYTATSRVQNVSLAQLRAAGNDYPAYIRQRYLGLPDELPQRVRDLALNLTADKLNIYDRAKAIESYLRQYPYSLDVPAPPSDRDVADYFLFDLKKGYCDYFATTMVVMARAAGMPARLVTGYSSGDYDYNGHRFVVVAADSHAWVEIYFPGIGWVEFEPTTNQSAFTHPGETPEPANAATNGPAPAHPSKGLALQIPWKDILPGAEIAGGVLAALALLLLTLPVENWTLLYLQPADKAIAAIYSRLYRHGPRWGIEADAARTPNEFARALAGQLEPLSQNKRLAPQIKSMVQDVYRLTRLYNFQLFSPFEISREDHRHAVQAWSRVRHSLSRLQRGGI